MNVPDAEAAREFYTGSMGAQARRLEAGVPPHWMPYFEVNDADEAASTTEAAGGTVSVPPFDTPYGRISVLNDPFGAVFSVNATPR